jgi:signal transduction histidine kinase/CheY-like chemotaxis protein/HPt (histidine-containing phosphotransfer) domain-containing protein
MNRSQKDEENQRSVQLVLLLCYMLYTIGLAIASITRGWEIWTIPVMFLGVAISWSLYTTGHFEFKFRIYIYAGFISLATFFYGTHSDALYHSALIIVLSMLLFALTEEKPALRILFMTYIMLMAYHILLIILKKEDNDNFFSSITLLNLLAVVVANRVAGYVCEMLSMSRGVSDDLERQLGEMKQKSEDFMANVSHELRTPINVVIGLSSILIKDEKVDRKRADLNAIQNAGRRLFGRIEDILDYTEIDTDSITISNDEYHISSIINDVVTEYRETLGQTAPELVVDMYATIPARMMGDALRIKRIIRHVVTNAAKFTDENGCVFLRVFARKKNYGVNLCIEVSDTGIGMSEEELRRVTTAAYQADSGRSRRVEGIGLGLSIVYGFVKEMGGFVHIQSEKKKGTKVSISIPQKVIDDKPSVVVDRSAKISAACYLKTSKYKSPAVREYYIAMLRSTFNELAMPFDFVTELDALKSLVDTGNITHICTAEEEYTEQKKYLEFIGRDIDIVVSVSPGFRIPRDSNATFVRKPVFSHSLVSAINRKLALWEFDPEISGKRLSFEDVKVLVVDDEEMNLIVAKGILDGYGMDVTLVRGGMEALHECEKTRFDVIFMDHMMPDVDGVEAMKLIRKHYGTDDHTVIIAFTANAVSGVREMFMKEGFDEFIAKPIESSELERVLKKVLPSTMWQYKAIEQEESYEYSYSNEGTGIAERFVVLDAAEGIRLCRGNEGFFGEVLEEFMRDSEDVMAELQACYERKDWANYRVILNGLKLSARIIGAEELSREAQEIERAAAEKWEAYIIANHESIERRIEEVNADISRVYGGDAS